MAYSAERAVQSLVQKVVDKQEAEHALWKEDPRFDFGLLASEPSRLFPWMLDQHRYLKPVYTKALENRGHNPNLNWERMDAVALGLRGFTNEALAFFVYSGKVTTEDSDEILLNNPLTRELIVADAIHSRRFYPNRAKKRVNGHLIGGYNPDFTRTSKREQSMISVVESTISPKNSYQYDKSRYLRDAKKQHPILIPDSATVEMCIPTTKKEFRSRAINVDLVPLNYNFDDLRSFLTMVYEQYRPKDNAPTLAELMPELKTHRIFREEIEEINPYPSGVFQPQPAYTFT